jgi:integrase
MGVGPALGKEDQKETFPTLAAARAWRSASDTASRHGKLHATARITFRAAAEEALAGMMDGTVRAKGGRPYKGSATEAYRTSLTRHVFDDLGGVQLGSLTVVDWRLVDRLVASGVSGQTARNAITAVSVVYRFACRRGYTSVNPCRELELPAGASRRERVVDPREAEELLAPLPLDLRALYAVAVYAGARRGEIAGLDWTDVRFDEGVVEIRRAWCTHTRAFVEPKTKAGARIIPMVKPLASVLLEWRLVSGGEGLVFPSAREQTRPFDDRAVSRRAETAWKRQAQERARAAGEDPQAVTTWPRLTLHEGRHSAASAFIASGRDPVRVSEWIGHSKVSTTTDIYAKAFKAREKADAEGLDAFYATFETEQPDQTVA